MIYQEDFAQLPPVFGSALYSGTVETQLMSHMTYKVKRLLSEWHCGISDHRCILRENMRQKTQTAEDNKLRTALEI